VVAVRGGWERVFKTASQRATSEGRGGIFDRAADTAIAYSRALDKGRVPLALRARHTLFSRLVYGRLRAALGGRCRYAVSGGAPLGERLRPFSPRGGPGWRSRHRPAAASAARGAKRRDGPPLGTLGRAPPGTAAPAARA